MNRKNIYFGLLGVLGLYWGGYWTYNKFQTIKTNLLTYDQTKKIIQQIKYQMLLVCISFSSQMNKRLGKIDLKNPQVNQYLREELSRHYGQKQTLILNKYQTNKQSYQASLIQFKNDQFIKSTESQILQMMERAVNSQQPDLTVKQEILNQFNPQLVKQIYLELSQQIIKLVLNRLKQSKINDPNFNSKDDTAFRNSIRSLHIYSFKVNFLIEKGFNIKWGCANELFLKVIETYKSENQNYRAQVVKIQMAYNKAINDISNDPQDFTEDKILGYFKPISEKGEQNKSSDIQSEQKQIYFIPPPPPPKQYIIKPSEQIKDQIKNSNQSLVQQSKIEQNKKEQRKQNILVSYRSQQQQQQQNNLNKSVPAQIQYQKKEQKCKSTNVDPSNQKNSQHQQQQMIKVQQNNQNNKVVETHNKVQQINIHTQHQQNNN